MAHDILARTPEIRTIPASATWDLRHQVLWPNKAFDYVKLPEDEAGQHFGVYIGTHLVSVISLFVKGTEAQFRKFATQPEEQGKGYGSKLLRHVMVQAQQQGVLRIWCNARLVTAGFYEKFGMQQTDHRFFKGDIPYVIMERKF